MAAAPGWLNAELGEEWIPVEPSHGPTFTPDCGTPAINDLFETRTSSSTSGPTDWATGTVINRADAVLLDGKGGGGAAAAAAAAALPPARTPLAALAGGREMFSPLKLESMFVPPSETTLRRSAQTPFTFECRTTAVRVPQPPQETTAISPLAHRAQAPRGVDGVFDFRFDTSVPEDDPGVVPIDEVDDDEEGSSGRDGDGDERDGIGTLSTFARSFKRIRLSPSSEAHAPELPVVPRSAVRDRIRARRLDRRASLPSLPTLSLSTPAPPVRYSMPASSAAHRPVDDLFTAERAVKAQHIMQRMRESTTSTAPTGVDPGRSMPPVSTPFAPTALGGLEVVVEADEESATSKASPFERPPPPTPLHALNNHSWLSSSSPPDLPPVDPARRPNLLVASATDELPPPTPRPFEGTHRYVSAQTSLGLSAPPRSAMKRSAPSLDEGGTKSPRAVSFGEAHPPLPRPTVPIGRRSTSALRYELSREHSVAIAASDSSDTGDDIPSPSRRPNVDRLGGVDTKRALAGSRASSDGSVFRSRRAARGATTGHRPSTNTTFLADCSLSVAKDLLVRCVADVEPRQASWAGLKTIDLSGKRLQSLLGLEDLLPALDEVVLCENDIWHIAGLPRGIRRLSVALNRLADVTSLEPFVRLERLDLSGNQIESLHALSALKHLRWLKADDNRITSLAGLERIDTLVKLSLRRNRLQAIEAKEVAWGLLETLDLAENKIATFELGRDASSRLISLNLDDNALQRIAFPFPCRALRILRLSRNPLVRLDLRHIGSLRTLFIDDTCLATLDGLPKLGKLEAFSARSTQYGKSLTLASGDIRELRRLYLSGNQIHRDLFTRSCSNLVYLELAMSRLKTLPDGLAACLPNCRTLILDHNPLADIDALRGLHRLSHLSLACCEVAQCRSLLDVLGTLPELAWLDTRGNPCVHGFYLPAPLPSVPSGADHAMYGLVVEEKPSDQVAPVGSRAWQEADRAFVANLSDRPFSRRHLWRTLALRHCPSLQSLDGLSTTFEAGDGQRLLDDLTARGRGGDLYTLV